MQSLYFGTQSPYRIVCQPRRDPKEIANVFRISESLEFSLPGMAPMAVGSMLEGALPLTFFDESP